MKYCPICKFQITKLSGGKCPSCRERLYRLDNSFVTEPVKHISSRLLLQFELRICQANGIVFAFNKGKEQAAQLAYAFRFYRNCEAFLDKQKVSIGLSPEEFSLKVLADILSDRKGNARTCRSMFSMATKLSASCSDVYSEYLKEQDKETLSRSIDLAPKFETMIL